MLKRSRRTPLVLGPVLAALLGLAWFLLGRGLDPERRAVRVATATPAGRIADRADGPATDRDREIFREKIAYARAERLDTLPLGTVLARLGRTFVGTPYVAHTLDVEGPERLVVNLRELDCVTFVENTLALARLVRAGVDDFDAFRAELTRIRYRHGIIDGYPSRLHYFSDWIADNEAKGLVRDVTRELGGVRDGAPIDFMSTHRDAYPQLEDPANFAAIRDVEAAASARPRYFIPEDRIAEVEHRIRNGDIIAATSTVPGLDVAHTGIALWIDGRLHLLHAPLVGKTVEISELPLADRVRRIGGQDGIVVVRPIP
ncbi:MAG TPA: N-acetylmuramoyl-L-alanine amidase-like domain-containing protein [Longimicrobiales bacterium]